MNTVMIEVDDDLFARASQLAAARNMTVAAMLERLLQVAAAPPPQKGDLPPLTRRAVGMAPPMTDEEVAQVLDEQRMGKTGLP